MFFHSLNFFIFFILTQGFFSCAKDAHEKIKIKEGNCIQEYNLKMASYADNGGEVYKIDKIKDGKLSIKRWYNQSWYYLGLKSMDFFQNTDRYEFKNAVCPDDPSVKTLKDRIKAINL